MRLNLLLAAACLSALLAACLLGSTPLPPARLLGALVGQGAPGDATVVWLIRLARAVAAMAAGAALGMSGAALQGLLRNPLAEPGVLGVSACGALAATVTLYFGLAASVFALPLASIVGALATTGLVAVVAMRTGSVATLILFGVGLSSFAGAVMALILNLAPNPFTLADMVNWTLGTVANRSFVEIGAAAPFLAAGAAMLLTHARGLSALTLGEEAAAGVGLDLARQRLAVVLGTGLLTGGSIAIAGVVGFVGTVAPHLVRPWVGHDPARSLVPSALAAGLFVTLADIVVRLIPTSSELRLGVVAALVGAPVFVAIAWARRGA